MFFRAIIWLVFVWLFWRVLDAVLGPLVQSHRQPRGTRPPGDRRERARHGAGRGHHGARRGGSTGSRRRQALEVLGLEADASDEEIRSAYRSLAQKYHPDRVAHLGPELVELTSEKFKQVQQSYEYLSAGARRS